MLGALMPIEMIGSCVISTMEALFSGMVEELMPASTDCSAEVAGF